MALKISAPMYSAASVRGDQQAQIQRFAVHLLDEHRLDNSAVDRIQEICGHDHDDNGQHELVVDDEAQSFAQFIEVSAVWFARVLFNRLPDVYGYADDGRRNKKGGGIQPEHIFGAHQRDQQTPQWSPDQACTPLNDVEQGSGAFDGHLRHLGQFR
jgi:hypothetical protein